MSALKIPNKTLDYAILSNYKTLSQACFLTYYQTNFNTLLIPNEKTVWEV